MIERRLLLLILLILDLLIISSSSVSLAGVCATLLFFLPGAAFALSITSFRLQLSERIALATACGLAGAVLVAAVQGVFPSQVQPELLFAFLNLASAIAIFRCKETFNPAIDVKAQGLVLLALVLLSCGMKVLHLDSAEFQGDEARAMFLASGFAAGDHSILLLHRKGPAEALLATPSLLLIGRVSEAAARLPFAVAGGILPLFAFVLTRRWVGLAPGAALVAAALVTCDGFLFAFSRIVQYQTPLVMFVAATFLSISLISSKDHSIKAGLLLAGSFFSAAALCHYDALFCLPALALYLWGVLRDRGVPPVEAVKSLLPGLLLGSAFLSAFYLPFLFHSHFSGTADYLSQRLGLQKLPVHNLARYLGLLNFYGGGFSALAGFTAALLGLLWWSWQFTSRRSTLFALMGAIVLVGATLLCHNPSSSKMLASLGALGLALTMLPLVTASHPPLPLRVFLLWIWVPLFVLGFLFARPNTHFYIFHLPLAIIAGAALTTLMKRLPVLIRVAGGLLGILVFGCSLAYLHTAYLNPAIEYRFAAPRAIPWFAKPFFVSGVSPGPFFGFQRRSGWKAIAVLYTRGTLVGSYGSNEEELVTSWYLWPAVRDQATPQNFYLVARPNDPTPVSPSKVAQGYHFWGRVYIDGQRGLDIMRSVPPRAAPQPLQLGEFIEEFDARDALFRDARAALAQAPSR